MPVFVCNVTNWSDWELCYATVEANKRLEYSIIKTLINLIYNQITKQINWFNLQDFKAKKIVIILIKLLAKLSRQNVQDAKE